MNEELKPCPFCGGKAMFFTIVNKSSHSDVGVMFKIKCMKCGTELPKSYECEMYMDQDALKKDLKSVTLSNGTLVNTNAVLYLLEEYPTAYDVDKVVEQLENERKFWENAYNRNLGKEKARSYEHAIEIVEGGGVK